VINENIAKCCFREELRVWTFFLPTSLLLRHLCAYVVMKQWFRNYGNSVQYNGHFDLRRSFRALRARRKVDWDSILFQNSFRSARVLASIYDFVSWIRSNRRIHFSGVDEYSVTGFSKSRGFRLSPLLSFPSSPCSSPSLSIFSPSTWILSWFTYEDFFTWLPDHPSVKFPHPIKFDRH